MIGLVSASPFHLLGTALSVIGTLTVAAMRSSIAAFRNTDGNPTDLASVRNRVATTFANRP